MNEPIPTTPVQLIVVGASGTIGAEVARLGVAYGADVYGITLDGVPPNTDPWTHGVTWIAGDGHHPSTYAKLPPAPVIIVAPVTPPDTLCAQARRIVWLKPVSLDLKVEPLENIVQAFVAEIDISPLSDAWVEVEDDSPAIRVETVAMALLRAALQDDVDPVLDQQQLAFLGDAVMLQ